jgi:hypothetical protein
MELFTSSKCSITNAGGIRATSDMKSGAKGQGVKRGTMQNVSRLLRRLIRRLLPQRFLKLINYGDTWTALYQTLIILAESAAWKLKFRNRHPRIDIQAGELILITVVRNEATRLPYFLDYYFKLGVDRIIVVNHSSTDNTRQVCEAYPNVHVIDVNNGFHLKPIFMSVAHSRGSDCSARGFAGHVSPGANQFCRTRDRHESPRCRPLFRPGQRRAPPCVWRPGSDEKDSPKVLLQVGQHFIHGCQLSAVTGRLLHFKFTSDFLGDRTSQLAEVATDGGLLDPWYTAQLKRYRATLQTNADLTLARPESVRYLGPDQLLELGLMQSSAAFQDWADRQPTEGGATS